MKKLLWMVLLAGCASVHGSSNDAALELAQAERAFAAAAQTGTVHDAFAGVLASDAVLFRPRPVNALEHMKATPFPPALHLYWAPSYAEVSADGSMGVTYGPYVVGQRGAAPSGSGRFVTIWKRVDGKWKVAVDIGAAGPLPFSVDSAQHHLETRVGSRRFPVDNTLQVHDDALNGGKFTRLRLEIAPSGDLGYTYGTHTAADKVLGWLRAYRRDASGNWQLIVDVT